MESFEQPESLISRILGLLSKFRFEFFVSFIVLLYGLYSTVAFEITCSRDLKSGVECTIVPHSTLLTFAPIKVEHPLAVDVVQRKPLLNFPGNANASNWKKPYNAVMRLEGHGEALTLIASHRYETIQAVADQINQFLQDRSLANFHASLP
jgi:hypothetical protein